MNKILYPWLIFLLGLSAATSLLQSIIHFLLGTQIFGLDSLGTWILVINITTLIGSMLLEKYYYCRKFWFVLAAGAVYYVCSFFYAILVFAAVSFHTSAYFSVSLLFVSIAAGTIYAVSLISLRAKGVGWLKVAGMYMCIIGLIYLSILIWRINHPSLTINNTVDRIFQWMTFASCVIPILFMMHFIDERRMRRTDSTDNPTEFGQNLAGMAGFGILMLNLIFGVIISSECYSSMYWSNQGHKNTLKLAELCDPGRFINNKGDTLRYRLLKPLNYDPAKKYPIVISLPYGGQPGTDTIRQIEGAVAAELLATESNRKAYPAFVFIPNCPPGGGWGGLPNYPTTDSLVFDAIIALDSQFSIDKQRRYVTGLSRGGYGTWNFICKQPDMFAAAVPVSGGGNPRLAPKVVNVAIWAFHGAKDKNVPVSGSRDMITAIKKAGGNPRYTEFPGEGHNIWDKVRGTPGLLDWLFAQHRDK
jgi:hypothetical protein